LQNYESMISNGAVISAYALDWILMVIFPENAMKVGGVIHHQAGLVEKRLGEP
jgi:hypothetical protein